LAESIQIPRTVREAKNTLTGHAALLTKTEWARSAIVRSFTADDDASLEEFAALGIVGLTNVDTIRHHRAAWQMAMEKGLVKEVRPGQTTKLPDLEFPANDTVGRTIRDEDRRDALRQQAADDGVGPSKVMDVASNPRAVATALKADPQFVSKLIGHLPSSVAGTIAARMIKSSPEAADAIIDDPTAHAAVIGAAAGRAGERHPAKHRDAPEPMSRLLHILNVAAVLKEARTMRDLVLNKFEGTFVWRPGEKEDLVSQLTQAKGFIEDALAVMEFQAPEKVS
jgi:hypothetical protein